MSWLLQSVEHYLSYHGYPISLPRIFDQNGVHRKQLENGYTADMISYYKNSEHVKKFLRKKATQAKSSAKTYSSRCMHFGVYIYKHHSNGGQKSLDEFINETLDKKHDPYDVLADLAHYLKHEQSKINPVSNNQIREITKAAKRLLRSCKVPVYNEDFHDLVPMPKKQKTDRKPVEKIEVTNMCKTADDIWLRTAIMMHASRGNRPIEHCAVRNCDVNFLNVGSEMFESEQFVPEVVYRAEFNKVGIELRRPMPKECARQIRDWYRVKYQKHHTTMRDESGKVRAVWVQPEPKPEDLILAHWHLNGETVTPIGVYDTLRRAFADLADRMGVGWQNKNRRKITLHSFRSFVKTTISDLGFRDYSEWYIGHDTSTYYRPSGKEIVEKFKIIEPYLTFLDYKKLDDKNRELSVRLERIDTELQEEKAKTAKLEELYNWRERLVAEGHIPDFKKNPAP